MNLSTPNSRLRTPDSTDRIPSLDLARGIATVLMIGAHATDAFLADAWKSSEIWYRIAPLFGFVAPAFLFLSGVATFIALDRRERTRSDDPHPYRSIVRRLLLILFLGYWIQIPNLSLRQLIMEQRPEEMARLFDSNILQVIAISGLLAVGLTRLLGSTGRSARAALIIGIAGVIATPYLWASGIHASLPLFIRLYLAPQPPATFALLPSLAYFMLGFALARWAIDAGGSWRRIGPLALVGAGLAGGGFALDLLLHPHPPHDNFWLSSSQHIVFRVGGLLILLALSHAAMMLRPKGSPIIRFAGRRSLIIYILHLMFFYGSPVTMGMRYWFNGALGRTLHPIIVITIIVGTLLAAVLLLKLWDRFERRSPWWARQIRWIAWGTFFIVFLLKP